MSCIKLACKVLGDMHSFHHPSMYYLPLSPESPPSWTCVKHLLGEALRKHLCKIPEPPQLPALDMEAQQHLL